MHSLNETSYKQLTSKERFDLALAAFSRGDENEISRLKRTCPQKNYRLMDLDYFGKIEGIVWTTQQFSEICERCYHHITLCEAYIAMFTLVNEQPQLSSDATQENLVKFQNARIERISDLKSAYQALSEFCNENNLNYDHVIQWLKISPELSFKDDNYLASGVNAKKEFIDYVKQKLLSIWQRYTKN